jgi:hypothetical protein
MSLVTLDTPRLFASARFSLPAGKNISSAPERALLNHQKTFLFNVLGAIYRGFRQRNFAARKWLWQRNGSGIWQRAVCCWIQHIKRLDN